MLADVRRTQMKMRFLSRKDGQRNLVEIVFSVVKQNFSMRAPGHLLSSQIMQVLFLGIAYNFFRH